MEYQKNTGRNIGLFEKGDVITRVVPSLKMVDKGNKNLGQTDVVELVSDTSFHGEPFELISIENNQIYLKRLSGIFKGKMTNGSLFLYEDGWDFFVLPEGLTIDDID